MANSFPLQLVGWTIVIILSIALLISQVLNKAQTISKAAESSFLIADQAAILQFPVTTTIPTTTATTTTTTTSTTTTSISGTRKLNPPENHHFMEAKSLLSKQLSLIRHRYEYDTFTGRQFLLTSNNIDQASWDLIKFKYAYKMTATGNQSFLMIFSGSSVTAGHDNFYNQSYPFVVERKLKHIFSLLGIELQVHNIAQGANNCIPYIHCYESMGGMSPDFVGWEQSYNCGRENAVFEAAARVAGWNELGGAAYFSASGAWLPKDCPASPDPIPYCSEKWTPAAANLPDYEFNIDEVQKIRDLLFHFNKGQPSSARFTSQYHKDYHNVAAHGFNVWEENPHCTVFDQKKGQNVSCNGIAAAEGCKLKFMSYEASLFSTGHGANWHPSAAFHLLRGEFIAWIYALILYDAIEMVENDLQSNSIEQLSQTPKHCNNINCLHRATCYTDYTPHYPTNMTLKEIIVGTHKWQYDDAELGDWSLKYGYQDAKPSYIAANSDTGEIHFLTSVGDDGKLWFCGPAKESVLHANFHIEAVERKVHFDRKSWQPNPNKRELWLKKKEIGNECKELHDLPPGDYVVSVASGIDKPVHLSHVICWNSKSKWHTSG